MALPATESFTGADGTLLTNLNSNWAANANNFAVYSNELRADDPTYVGALARWSADSFANDQYASCTLTAIAGSGDAVGPAVRVPTTGVTGYFVFADNYGANTRELAKLVAGTYTTLASDATTESVGVVYRIDASGSTITAKRNGATIFSVTDSSIASGAAGVFGFGNGTGSRIDIWEGGNQDSGTPARKRTGGIPFVAHQRGVW